ncbi:hypothetical protein EYF80_040963 [Liparis tanakae]|uniref:Uncharacterized protein n=1 Tax=Liparis tanakae TaxID=230148 RepID=A0A4Z2G5N3_9TELE|nr:hypothetical protein EYF80_040963 [Liparis tanakae]
MEVFVKVKGQQTSRTTSAAEREDGEGGRIRFCTGGADFPFPLGLVLRRDSRCEAWRRKTTAGHEAPEERSIFQLPKIRD